MVYNINELSDTLVYDRMTNDIQKFKNITETELHVNDIWVVRLGKLGDKPRPLLISTYEYWRF